MLLWRHKRGTPSSALGTWGVQIRGACQGEVAGKINLEREVGISQEKGVVWRDGGGRQSLGRETETETGRRGTQAVSGTQGRAPQELDLERAEGRAKGPCVSQLDAWTLPRFKCWPHRLVAVRP